MSFAASRTSAPAVTATTRGRVLVTAEELDDEFACVLLANRVIVTPAAQGRRLAGGEQG